MRTWTASAWVMMDAGERTSPSDADVSTEVAPIRTRLATPRVFVGASPSSSYVLFVERRRSSCTSVVS